MIRYELRKGKFGNVLKNMENQWKSILSDENPLNLTNYSYGYEPSWCLLNGRRNLNVRFWLKFHQLPLKPPQSFSIYLLNDMNGMRRFFTHVELKDTGWWLGKLNDDESQDVWQQKKMLSTYTLNWLLLRWEYSRIKDIYPLKYFIKSQE